MKRRLIFQLLLILLCFNLSTAKEMQWFKGQLHCHTTNSDGDETPETVVNQYKGDGYDFVAITDHNVVTDVTHLNTDDFITFPSVEITGINHVNAFNINKMVSAWWETQIAIDQAISNGADLVQFNHPEWSSLSANSVANFKHYHLLEVLNADDESHTYDIGVWDTCLTRGKRIFGTGTDDAHDYTDTSKHYDECWVMTLSDELTIEGIINSLKSGDFYFCDRGVTIDKIHMFDRTLEVHTEENTTITFIGTGGKELATMSGPMARFTMDESDTYVRAEVSNDQGHIAYTQAYTPEQYTPHSGKITATDQISKIKSGSDASIDISMFAEDHDVESILFYANNKFIGSGSANDERFSWESPADGTYEIKAKFVTADNTYYWSNPLPLTVGPGTSQLFNNSLFNSKHTLSSTEQGLNLTVQLDQSAPVKVTLFNLAGQVVGNSTERQLAAGTHTLTINDKGSIAPGMYSIQATIGNQSFNFKKYCY